VHIHAFSDDLTSNSPNLVKIGIPELVGGLDLEPAQAHKQTIYNAGGVLLAAGIFRGLHHIVRDDVTVWVG
jgi:hypothetical protein